MLTWNRASLLICGINFRLSLGAECMVSRGLSLALFWRRFGLSILSGGKIALDWKNSYLTNAFMLQKLFFNLRKVFKNTLFHLMKYLMGFLTLNNSRNNWSQFFVLFHHVFFKDGPFYLKLRWYRNYWSYYFAPFNRLWVHKYALKRVLFLPDVCQLRSGSKNDVRSRFWTWKMSSFKVPKCSKFVAECGCSSEISQNVQKIRGFFGKLDEFFFENKPWIFSKFLIAAIFA